MPIVCINRPNRSERRVWTARKVGQVCGYALREGATQTELASELEECLGLPEQCDCALIRELIEGLLSALAAAILILGAPRGIVIRSFIELVRILVRRIPALAGLLAYLQRLETARNLLEEIRSTAERIRQLVVKPNGG